MIRTWVLQDDRQSLVLASCQDRLPEIVYWGARLPHNDDPESVARAVKLDVTGGMLDVNPDMSICPEVRQSFPGQPGLSLRLENGLPLLPRFRFLSADATTHRLELAFSDERARLNYTAYLELDPETHIITSWAEIEAKQTAVFLDWLSAPVFPAPQFGDEILDFSGRWCGEFQMNRTQWSAGMRFRENRTGRTGHEHFPGALLPCHGATNTQGEAYGFHYGWSGGHRMVAEELPDGRRQIQFGHAAGSQATPKQHFATAPLYSTYSGQGLNGCAVAFQRHLRDRIVQYPKPDRMRPVHYNCWEAVYFDHNLPDLKDIANRAAALGAERFVLDDGWFGTRDNDTRALSDWVIDARKYPDGLAPLIRHVHGLGMTFGIWFEPEMINPDSDVYRNHPDWALGDVDQVLGRHQKVLNMARADVRAYLFDRISAILAENDIDYIKWDHNRVLPMPDADQAHGAYALIDQVRTAFPKVELESCASGGGRIDFGILARTHRVWLSDSNDALERLKIQHNAALFLPMVVTGSHVGPRHCHTSGRTIDMGFRAWVAAQRHMGFEMDPRELTEDETRILCNVTNWWKSNRSWMTTADILRLDSADPAVLAEQQIARDGARFVVFAGKAETSRQILPRPLRLAGLDPKAHYRVSLANRADVETLSRGQPLLKSDSFDASGQFLMSQGVTLPWRFPLTMCVLDGSRL